MLHRVIEKCSEGKNRELEVTPQFLEQTVKEYRSRGYCFVSIDEACDIIQSGKKQHHPFVCLTFDDGYHDNYTTALPLLRRLQVPFAVYVTTGFIDNRLPMWWYPGEQLGISTESLKVLDADPLCTIGAHTISHPKLDTLSLEEQKKEIEQSHQELESLLGHPIHHFSYPHGAYNADTLSIINQQAFRSVLLAWGGNIRRGADPLILPRIELQQP
ncbi:MAG: polysaccharide deacetylase family protein [Bacteroidales bacterium]|nr:polysaccharide deacetylase family protein [Bacteroidales bacterium]